MTKEFKRAGNKLVLVGEMEPGTLGGSVYADSYGQRGNRLYDPGATKNVIGLWDALHQLHQEGKYFSGSAIAEGGIALRLFEASYGSELGARLDCSASNKTRADGELFGEFIGSVLLEISPEADLDRFLARVPHRIVGDVIVEPSLTIIEDGKTVWSDSTSKLAESWSKTFREVVE